MLNNFFTFVLKSCAFTANPKEITVNDVASTFDTADQGCKFFGNLIFREISWNISKSLEVLTSIIFIRIRWYFWELFYENLHFFLNISA